MGAARAVSLSEDASRGLGNGAGSASPARRPPRGALPSERGAAASLRPLRAAPPGRRGARGAGAWLRLTGSASGSAGRALPAGPGLGAPREHRAAVAVRRGGASPGARRTRPRRGSPACAGSGGGAGGRPCGTARARPPERPAAVRGQSAALVGLSSPAESRAPVLERTPLQSGPPLPFGPVADVFPPVSVDCRVPL